MGQTYLADTLAHGSAEGPPPPLHKWSMPNVCYVCHCMYVTVCHCMLLYVTVCMYVFVGQPKNTKLKCKNMPRVMTPLGSQPSAACLRFAQAKAMPFGDADIYICMYCMMHVSVYLYTCISIIQKRRFAESQTLQLEPVSRNGYRSER